MIRRTDERSVQLVFGTLVLSLIITVYFCAVTHELESDNTIAYSLPAANFVERGHLSLPQLGSQYHLDRYWLLNSPLMGLGQVPIFAVLGTSRFADLTGVICCGLFSLSVLIVLFRHLSNNQVGFLGAILAGFGLMGHRFVFAELYNQRYLLLAFGVLGLTFYPFQQANGKKWRYWQWGLAGSLTLVHPSNLPAQVLWVIQAVQTSRRDYAESPEERSFLRLYPCESLALLAGLCLTLIWYARPEPLMNQFLPHVTYGEKSGNLRSSGRLGGMLGVPISTLYAIPSQLTSLFVVALAWVVGFRVVFQRDSEKTGVKIAAFTLAVVSLLDLFKGFGYIIFYIVGLAPGIIAEIESLRWKKRVVSVLCVLGVLHLVVALKFDTDRPMLVDTPETIAFIEAHTRPGDTIVTGPPFVLASSFSHLNGNRRVLYVVPEPYWLSAFSQELFRQEISGNTTVYIGSETWYNKQVGQHIRQAEPTPLYADGEMQKLNFYGVPVIVVRDNH